MGDQRDLTMGIRFELSKAVSQLTSIMDAIGEIRGGFQTVESAADAFGTRVAHSVGAMAGGLGEASDAAEGAAGSLEGIADAGEEVRGSFQDIGENAEEFGSTVADAGEEVCGSFQEMGESAEEFGSTVAEIGEEVGQEMEALSKIIRAGIQGVYKDGEKRVKEFGTKAKSGAAQVKDAVLHPIRTIKSGMTDMLVAVIARLRDTGEESEDTGEDLKGMGRDGETAGTRIKDAVGSAVKSFFAVSVAIEAFKAGIELVKGLAASIKDAGIEAERTGAKFDAMFDGDSGVGEWAENFSEAIHRSGQEVQSFLVSNKRMYEELGITGQAADDLSKITTSLAYDFGSAFKMEDAEALGVIQDYISGNTNALLEYGIQIDDAVLKQSALAMGLGEDIEGLGDAAMAQVRMNALLEDSATIQQAAAKKQEGYTNSIKSLKGVWTDFLSSAAERFAPVFTSLTDVVISSWPQIEPALMGMVDLLSNGLAEGIPVIADLASSAIPPLIQTTGELFAAAAPIGGAFLDLAVTALPPLVSAVSPIIETFGTLAKTILPPLASIIGEIATTVVPPLVTILKTLSENVIAPLMPHIESIASSILPALAAGLELIPPILEIISPILSGIADILSRVVGFLSKIAEWAAGGLSSLLDKAAGFLGTGKGMTYTGAQIPHNADGDDDFMGGWTHINERGGELAFLPSGSVIVPADKSDKIMDGGRSQTMSVSAPFAPEIKIEVSGGGGIDMAAAIKDELRQLMKELYQEMQEEHFMSLAIQQGNA